MYGVWWPFVSAEAHTRLSTKRHSFRMGTARTFLAAITLNVTSSSFYSGLPGSKYRSAKRCEGSGRNSTVDDFGVPVSGGFRFQRIEVLSPVRIYRPNDESDNDAFFGMHQRSCTERKEQQVARLSRRSLPTPRSDAKTPTSVPDGRTGTGRRHSAIDCDRFGRFVEPGNGFDGEAGDLKPPSPSPPMGPHTVLTLHLVVRALRMRRTSERSREPHASRKRRARKSLCEEKTCEFPREIDTYRPRLPHRISDQDTEWDETEWDETEWDLRESGKNFKLASSSVPEPVAGPLGE